MRTEISDNKLEPGETLSLFQQHIIVSSYTLLTLSFTANAVRGGINKIRKIIINTITLFFMEIILCPLVYLKELFYILNLFTYPANNNDPCHYPG